MSIYTKKHYRKIYEEHYGPIPKDDNGRSYEIHHIDGDHSNSSINNLKLVTIQEHYDIHYAQGDWHACLLISQRMTIDPATKSELSRLGTKKLMAAGNHPFQSSEYNSLNQRRRIADGTHHMLSGEIQRATQQRLAATGKHNFQGKATTTKQLVNGTHPSQKRICCIHCKKDVNIGTFTRDHKACVLEPNT